MKKTAASKKVKPYVKASVNIPDDLQERLDNVMAVLGGDKSKYIVRGLRELMPTLEAEAEAVTAVRENAKKPK